MTVDELRGRLRIPVIAAPMFLVSGVELVLEACRAGVLGSFPSINARSVEELEQWLQYLNAELNEAEGAAPYAVNLIVRPELSPRYAYDLALIERYKPPVVITSVGPPGDVAARVHDYGGLVFHDVASIRHAEKAIEQGVDGLILLTAGAGGHTGSANPFAFIPQVRRFWSGAIALAGGIADGRAVKAAITLGADFAYVGTRFAATQESLANDAYRALLLSETMADIIVTDRITGMKATFMRGSLVRAGLDPNALPPPKGFLQPDLPEESKAWRDIWSGGHGVGLIEDIPPVAELVARMAAAYDAA